MYSKLKMPSDPKALMAAIQQVLKEHDVGQARVSLDLFDAPNKNNNDIQIYVEQHHSPIDGSGRPIPASEPKAPLSPPREMTTSSRQYVGTREEASRLLSGMKDLKGAAHPSSPKKAEALPRPSSARSRSPEEKRTHMYNERPAGAPAVTTTTRTSSMNSNINSKLSPLKGSPMKASPLKSTPTAGRRAGTEADYEDVEPRILDSTAPGDSAVSRAIREETSTAGGASRSSGDREDIDMSNLKVPDNLMAMLGLGGGAGAGGLMQDQLKSEEERQERLRVLKSWVGKSTLLDYKKQKEKLAAEPPKQFISSKVNINYTPPSRNLADGDRNDILPELAALTPRPMSNGVPTSQTVKDIRQAKQRLSTSTTRQADAVPSLSGKTLQEMLAEQRLAEQKNREGLKEHQKTMEECRKYIAEVEADPERRNLVEFIKNPLTKKPTPPTEPRPERISRPHTPTKPSSGIQVKRVTLPEEEAAKEEVMRQLNLSSAGREHLSNKERYSTMLQNLDDELRQTDNQKMAYKDLLEAAIKYNEKLGIKEGKP